MTPGSDRKTAYLGMPGYGLLTSGAARGLYCSSRALNVNVLANEGSLLAQNFNILWCWALTARRRGSPVDYFAMIHADVEPEDGWLDILVAELEEKNLDVLGAVVPIKDQHGVTSLALGREDGDPWLPKCRLTMREVFRLPETFTSEDLGHQLLLNTGLWVCRFNPAWVEQVHFTINDRIQYDPQKDVYVAQSEPEDWNFSRQLHDLGLRIGATRKVRLRHAGPQRFTNERPWGADEFDTAYLTETAVPEHATGWFHFPFDVAGWLLPDEGRALADLAKGKDVLEVGSYCGKSTCCLAQTANHVTSVDPGDGRATPKPRDTSAELEQNLRAFGVRDKVDIQVGTLATVKLSRQFDLAFIDGAHDAESVRSDIAHAMEVLKPGGLLVFHDYRRTPGEFDGRWDPDVTLVVNEFLANGASLVSTHATLAVVKPPAGLPLEV